MRIRILLLISLFLASHVLLAQRYRSAIKDRPRWARPVNDYGNLLSWGQINKLESEVNSYRKRTGKAIVIITLSSLPYSIKETSIQYFNKWGIGSWLRNNGVLILVSRYPRRVRITTGSGIDHILTDYDCQRIVDETIVPYFQSYNFFGGLMGGVNDIEAVLGDRRPYAVERPAPVVAAPQAQTPPPQPEQIAYDGPDDSKSLISEAGPWFFRGILLFVLIIWLRIRYLRRRVDAKTFNAEGFGAETDDTKKTFLGYLVAIGMVLFWVIKYTLLLPVVIFGFIFKLFRGSSGGRSFRGGRTSGGGASGSW
ncbi:MULTISPECIES: TPM domain-containing protein [Niastella]|uniref:TPM domain-containing protein n=1 Tax=Niastella soli TaxID=2821487 RepID=A0ABS3YR37_9BACT|nr:TPM domain-containing protein [Niastella soli]MBO9199661.1 TPM domain-containing protein [Niastella soli]